MFISFVFVMFLIHIDRDDLRRSTEGFTNHHNTSMPTLLPSTRSRTNSTATALHNSGSINDENALQNNIHNNNNNNVNNNTKHKKSKSKAALFKLSKKSGHAKLSKSISNTTTNNDSNLRNNIKNVSTKLHLAVSSCSMSSIFEIVANGEAYVHTRATHTRATRTQTRATTTDSNLT